MYSIPFGFQIHSATFTAPSLSPWFRKAAQYFHPEKLEPRYLTEDEYREQGETETAKALEELRVFCRNPTFPSWIAVVKLQSPQK